MMTEETKAEIRHNNPLEVYLPKRGIELHREGRELKGLCPFHQDGKPSLDINVGKQAWYCRAGCGGGDLFAFVMKLDGLKFMEAAEKLAGRPLREPESSGGDHAAPGATPAPRKPVEKREQINLDHPDEVYSYTDLSGQEVFQALRYQLGGGKKTFRQRQFKAGKWEFNLDGIDETPVYHLPQLQADEEVWVPEGEKDVHRLESFGFTATCNPMGAGKWYEHHSRMLAGKRVILCGDNDEPGQKHIAAVEKSLALHAKSTRRIQVPAPYKDLSEFLDASVTPEAGMLVLMELSLAAPELYQGIEMPFQSLAELETDYALSVTRDESASVDLSRWLPSLKFCVRPLVPGELVTFLGGTGVGKTAILQNIALALCPLPILLFELELPGTLTFERFAALLTKQPGEAIYSAYKGKREEWPAWRQPDVEHRVYTCSRSGVTVDQMTRWANFAHLKLGVRPAVIMVDYFGLISAAGKSRYERMSDVAESLKVMAKATDTVVIAAAQVDRDAQEREDGEIFLTDAKDSGSIENSSGLVVGAWRDRDDPAREKINFKILKNTKGKPGRIINARCDETLRITELARTKP